ncbi:MAG: hypothetical protein IKN04_03455 [Clostridia bacterium]|nr:hypothetical protein [Clostridia bacterium]MBR6185152.1 hypothetical protein [Clostridia bacterium]
MKKKLLCGLLAVLMMSLTLLAAVPASAESKAMTFDFMETAVLSMGQSAQTLKTKIHSISSGTIVYSLADQLNKTVVYTETRNNVHAGQELVWQLPYDDTGLSGDKPVKQMRASFLMDGVTYTYDVFYTYQKKDGLVSILVEKATWYPNNTACSFGPAFRDVKPSLTEKWYLFTAVDLSIQGRQEFEYIASNMYVIGKVYVDVNGDQVTVTYHNFYADQGGNTETLSEFFTFFHDLKSVKNVEPETMSDPGYQFGQPISIQNDLEGDMRVLLFIRNRVTYRDYVNNSHKLTRFWPNLQERRQLREQMIFWMNE